MDLGMPGKMQEPDNVPRIDVIDPLFKALVQNVSRFIKQNPEEKDIVLADLIIQMFNTHQSIMVLMKTNHGEADALSLVREQIELLFKITLLLCDPKKWTERYFQDSFVNIYYGIIQNEKVEPDPAKNPMIKEGMKHFHFDESYWKAHYNYFFNIEDGPKELHPQFPSVGKTLRKVDSRYIAYLENWYRYYRVYSGYSHGTWKKMGFERVRSLDTFIPHRKLFEKAEKLRVLDSYLAILSVIETTLRKYNAPSGLIAEVTKVLNALEPAYPEYISDVLSWNPDSYQNSIL